MNHVCYLGLGGNLGEPHALFDLAIAQLQALPDASDVRESPRYESEPIDSSGPNYINSVIELNWAGTPEALLAACLNLEALHGRVRTTRNAPRLIDLDVLLVGSLKINTEALTVPHPRLHLRRFVLQPLLDLQPNLELPGLGPALPLLVDCADQMIKPCAKA